ncbi:hypothetical protein V501_06785 [Pseudogymnoascus sp. VKM F-4519 (FW-2642)]|nr:hypothetical protein V501_06785 [Pseudogymnoascus sp. VKM F-4519 (FW-2642)]
MQIPLLTTASLSLLLAVAAATPLTTSTTPSTEGATFDSSTPPKPPRMVAGLQGGGMALAGAAAGVGAAGTACACCRKKPARGEKRYRAGQDESGGCGRQRRRKAEDVEEAVEGGVDGEEVRGGGAEDGFRHAERGERVSEMPDTPPPSYARLAGGGEEIELEARPVGKGEISKEV